MATKIFVNLPVKDLKRSVEFFTRLGYTFNPQFTDENATCMIVAEDIYVMLLVEKFFKTFTPKPIADATQDHRGDHRASRADSRAAVDDLVAKAVAAGGTTPTTARTTASCTSTATRTSTVTSGKSSGWTRPRFRRASSPRPSAVPRRGFVPSAARRLRAS